MSASEREERQLNAVKAALESAGSYVRVWTPRTKRQLNGGIEEMNREGGARPGLQGPEPPSIPDEE